MQDVHDAIIVGGRVAGTATALLLARAGRRVLVLERGRYGSDTLSTHAFMRGGVMQLGRFGLLDALVAAGTPPVRRTVIRYGDTEQVVAVRPSPYVDALYAPRRSLLDRVLADAAIAAGAEVRFATTVTELLHADDGAVVGVRGHDAQGRRFEARAPITIGADGLRSRVAREVGALTYRRGQHATGMVLSYLSGLEVDGYQWLYGSGASAGLIPTNDGLVCAWVGLPADRFRSALRGRPDHGLVDGFAEVAPDWAARVADARRHGPVRGFPGVPGFLRQPWGRGWALVGDASHFKDPLTTHGMTDALRDAELLARAVLEGEGSPARLEAALVDYHATRDRLSLPLFEAADRVAAFDWELGALRELLLDVSAAMRPELDHLAGLEPMSVAQPVAA